MRRIFLALLICLLPLQSFAGMGMGVKMAGMEIQMANASQAPCHEAYEPMQAADQDCCGSQAMCKAACPVAALIPSVMSATVLPKQTSLPAVLAASFQSADLRAGFKPPIL